MPIISLVLNLYYHFSLIMNTVELFDDYVEMAAISKFAEDNELTVDYVIEEFVINNQLITID